MNKIHISKKVAFALAFAAVTAAPPSLKAQSDGFFGSYRDDSRNGNDLEITNQTFGSNSNEITNQTFGEAPLGGGMAILVASAAGYALLKRRKNDKSTESTNS